MGTRVDSAEKRVLVEKALRAEWSVLRIVLTARADSGQSEEPEPVIEETLRARVTKMLLDRGRIGATTVELANFCDTTATKLGPMLQLWNALEIMSPGCWRLKQPAEIPAPKITPKPVSSSALPPGSKLQWSDKQNKMVMTAPDGVEYMTAGKEHDWKPHFDRLRDA